MSADDRFPELVQDRAGLASREQALRATEVVMGALGARLTPGASEPLDAAREQLGAELRGLLAEARDEGGSGAAR